MKIRSGVIKGVKSRTKSIFSAILNFWILPNIHKSIDTSHGWIGMKFGTLLECRMLYQMTPRVFQSEVAFKVKLKATLFKLRFDLESDV